MSSPTPELTLLPPADAGLQPSIDGAVEVVLDRPDLSALLRSGLHPAALPCARCGVRQGHHRTTAACPTFVRPDLPSGYAYADQLVAGQDFGFLPVVTDCTRQVVDTACCVVGSMTVITSRASGCRPATHWVDGSLPVATGATR